MGHLLRRFWLITIITVASLVNSACGAGATDDARPTVTLPPTSGVPGAPSPSEAPCTVDDVEAKIISMPRGAFVIALTSKIDRPCDMQGRPQIAFYDSADQRIPTIDGPVTADLRAAVRLVRGDSAYFTANYQPGRPECPVAAKIYISPPGHKENLRLPLPPADAPRLCPESEITAGHLSATAEG